MRTIAAFLALGLVAVAGARPAEAGTGNACQFLPVVIDVEASGTRYRTEVSFTNPNRDLQEIAVLYTASLGRVEGTGEGRFSIPGGEQVLVLDAIEFLRGLGIGIQESTPEAAQAGTLRVCNLSPGETPIGVMAQDHRADEATLHGRHGGGLVRRRSRRRGVHGARHRLRLPPERPGPDQRRPLQPGGRAGLGERHAPLRHEREPGSSSPRRKTSRDTAGGSSRSRPAGPCPSIRGSSGSRGSRRPGSTGPTASSTTTTPTTVPSSPRLPRTRPGPPG